eukprot:482695-Pleurochrysis_carterae.AAC.1
MDVRCADVIDVVAYAMSPAAVGVGMCALECMASPFACRHSLHAKLRAIDAHDSWASRVHFGSSLSTSARL